MGPVKTQHRANEKHNTGAVRNTTQCQRETQHKASQKRNTGPIPHVTNTAQGQFHMSRIQHRAIQKQNSSTVMPRTQHRPGSTGTQQKASSTNHEHIFGSVLQHAHARTRAHTHARTHAHTHTHLSTLARTTNK